MLASNALYQGVFNRIDSATGNTPLFDHTPQGAQAVYPMIVMEEHQADNWDTDDSVGAKVTLYVEVWSQYEGLKEIQTIMSLIYDVLHRQESYITLDAGFKVVQAQCIHDEIAVSDDGLTRASRMSFEFLVSN